MAKKSTSKLGAAVPMPGEDNWRAQDALRTLTRADEIRRDKDLMRQVKVEAQKQIKATSKVIAPNGKRK